MVVSRRYPTWVGLVGAVWGLGNVAIGLFVAYVGFDPERAGFILPVTQVASLVWLVATSVRIAAISSGVVSLLAGQQPPTTGGSSPTWLALWALVDLIALQAVGIARSVVLLRRWKTKPATRPDDKMTVILHVILPISVSFVWALVCLVAVPALVATHSDCCGSSTSAN
jgi:hypothetical protein